MKPSNGRSGGPTRGEAAELRADQHAGGRTGRRFGYALPALAYMGLIYFLSSLPQDRIDDAFGLGVPDEILHAAGYGGLAITLHWALDRAFRVSARAALWLTWMLAVIYGATDEVHQSYVPGRDASIGDLFADAVGAGLVVLWIGRGFIGGGCEGQRK